MSYTTPHKSIPAYLAGELSLVAGAPVNICDSRGDGTDERFTLKNVPPHVDLCEISRGIARYHRLDERLVVPFFNDANYHTATLHGGDRERIPRAILNVTRCEDRVWVDITPLTGQ